MNSTSKMPIVLAIGGSDNTAGAGIQADVTTINQLGCHPVCVITAVTSQNPMGVHSINPVALEVIASQIKSICDIQIPKVIKIGLLANIAQVEMISQWLTSLGENKPVVIYDPVAVASNGSALTEQDILPSIKEKLLPVVDIITPNAQESQTITGEYILSWDSLPSVATQINKLGVSHCILKGGHVDLHNDYCVDMLQSGTAPQTPKRYWVANRKINTKQSHGTGCTFASAIASFVAREYHIRDAFMLTNAYVHKCLSLSRENPFHSLTRTHFPSEKEYFGEVLLNNSPLAKELDWYQEDQLAYRAGFEACTHLPLGLYPVVDSVDWVERLLKLGVKTVQIRIKHLAGDLLKQALTKAVALGNQYDAQVFINDYWQLAIELDAYGVHLGQEDMDDANLLAIQNAGLRLGISTHGHYELLKMHQLKPSYLAIGAIFPTKTKNMTGQIQGLTALKQLLPLLEGTPVTAIGGISIERAEHVLATGIKSIAVVTAITEAENPDKAAQDFLNLLS